MVSPSSRRVFGQETGVTHVKRKAVKSRSTDYYVSTIKETDSYPLVTDRYTPEMQASTTYPKTTRS